MSGEPSLFRGKLVRLAAHEPGDIAVIAGWTTHSEYMRLIDTDPARPFTLDQVGERYGVSDTYSYYFGLRTLRDDRLIGFVSINSIEWSNGAGKLSMGIGDPADWGHGYGSDALRLVLRYVFTELSLHRLGLDVIASNTRAVRLYERAGFQREGRVREAVYRDGSREDLLLMGILRSDWEAANATQDKKTGRSGA